MHKTQQPKFTSSFIVSVVIHILVFALIGNWFIKSGNSLDSKQSEPRPKITKATVIKQEDLQKELARLAKIDNEKEFKRKADLKLAQQLEKKRKAEQAKIKKLQELADRELAAKKKQLEELKAKQIAEAKKQRELEEKNRAAEKRQKELALQAEKKKQLELEKKIQAQVKAEQLAQEKRIAEEKKLQERLRQEQEEIARQKAESERQAKAQAKEENIAQLIKVFGFKVKQKVAKNWIVQGKKEGINCVLNVLLAPGGLVVDVEVLNSSGDVAFDRSAVAAVYKSSPLPVPTDPDAFERMRQLRLTLRPDDVMTAG